MIRTVQLVIGALLFLILGTSLNSPVILAALLAALTCLITAAVNTWKWQRSRETVVGREVQYVILCGFAALLIAEILFAMSDQKGG